MNPTITLPVAGPGQVPANGSDPDELVLTPGGYKPRSKVFLIETGHHIAGRNDRLWKIESSTGREVQDLGATQRHVFPLKPHFPRQLSLLQTRTTEPLPAPGDGWVAYAVWMNTNIKAINQFTANWIVPSAPVVTANQTIFLFIGMQNTEFILQPVLQWGKSAAGGGDYWSISNWYTDGKESSTCYTDPVRVEPGQTLRANIQLLAQVDRSFTYMALFENYPGLKLEKDDVIELLYANVVLESYRVTSANQYPADGPASINDVRVFIQDQPVSPAWQLEPHQIVPTRPSVLISGLLGNTIELDFGQSAAIRQQITTFQD